ncbi:hypothetical protein [Nocardioides sambongensis]|uniref:hypothetical protein n=1 Tax=Nocardioides sambongensis TaxID=2589074 RepID=UPI00112ECC50|nr:hypothetical protein [Nocardioides sambongensis]
MSTQGPPSWQPKPASGALAWGLGLVALMFCLPIVAQLITGVLMAVVGRAQRDKGPLAAENGRNAANWG